MPLPEEFTHEHFAALTSGMDTPLHSHQFDRTPTHSTLDALQALTKTKTTSVNYTATYADDFILVTTVGVVITITLPYVRNGKVFTVIRIGGSHQVNVAATSPDTINGAASHAITGSYDPHHYKAFTGIGWLSI